MHRESSDKQKVFETPGPGVEISPLLDAYWIRKSCVLHYPVGVQ